MANLQTFTFDLLAESTGKILVKFGAPWCGPCRTIEPVLEAMAEDGFKVYDVNTDENQELAARFGIRSVPTLIIFENGKQIETLIGVQPRTKLEELLK